MLNKQFLWRVQGLAAWQRKPRLISHSCRIHAIREFYTRMEYLIGRKFGFIWNNVRVRESSLEETRLDIVKIAILIATWSPRRLKKIKKESDRFNFARRIGQHLDHFEMENVARSLLTTQSIYVRQIYVRGKGTLHRFGIEYISEKWRQHVQVLPWSSIITA